MWKPIWKFVPLPAGLLLASLAAAPASADSLTIIDGSGGGSGLGAHHVTVSDFQVADGRRHGRDDDDDDDDWRGRGRGHGHYDRYDRGKGRDVIIVRPAPRVVYQSPRVIYREKYVYPRRSYYDDRASNFLGAFAGAVIGGIIGSSMDRSDHSHASYVLENGRTGYRSEWRNPDSGYDYAIVPTRTYQYDGQYCREYTTWGRIGGREQQLYGQACRMPDGSWRRVG